MAESLPKLLNVVATTQGPSNMIEMRKPKEAALALEMLAGGATYAEVKEKTGLTTDSLVRLRSRHQASLEVRRKQLATDALQLAEALRMLQLEKARQLLEDPEQLKKVNIRDLTLPYGIAQDKFFGAMGEAQTVVEHRTGASIAEAAKAIEEAKANARKAAVEVNVTPVKPNA